MRLHPPSKFLSLLDEKQLVIDTPWKADEVWPTIYFIVTTPVLGVIGNMIPSGCLGIQGFRDIPALTGVHLSEP